MQRGIIILILFISCLLISFPVNANLISNSGFENSTGINQSLIVGGNSIVTGDTADFPSTFEKFSNTDYSVGSNEGEWIDRRQWVRAHGVDYFDPDAPLGYGGDYFAYHAYQGGNHTDLLTQAFDASAFSAGDTITLSFNYILDDLGIGIPDPGTATLFAFGFGTGGSLDAVAAAWNYMQDSGSPVIDLQNITDTSEDGVLLRESLAATDGWDLASYIFQLDKDYEAIAVSFRFQIDSTSAFQGVDNVKATGSAPVPEPATLFLLGSGLVGLVGFGRKKFLKK